MKYVIACLLFTVCGCDALFGDGAKSDPIGVSGSGGTKGGTGGVAAGGSGGSENGGSAGAGAAPTSCPRAEAGPELVFVSAPGAAFCMDATLVSQAQYAEFVAQTTLRPDAHEWCADNTTFVPEPEQEDPQPYQPDVYPTRPVGTDWCDARAYCEWAGKRLCGKLGGGPQPSPVSAPSFQGGEFYLACSSGGELSHPPGGAACRMPDDVDSDSLCRSGYPGFTDLDLLAASCWVDGCFTDEGDPAEDGPAKYCAEVGGTDSPCDHTGVSLRLSRWSFRCCADAR